jgi:hypothetical protein
MTDHPIIPPPELVQQWWEQAHQHPDRDDPQSYYDFIANQAARWGADQELEACFAWLHPRLGYSQADELRVARRLKPSILKQQALAALSRADKDAMTNPLTGDVVALRTLLTKDQAFTIRRALEALPDD